MNEKKRINLSGLWSALLPLIVVAVIIWAVFDGEDSRREKQLQELPDRYSSYEVFEQYYLGDIMEYLTDQYSYSDILEHLDYYDVKEYYEDNIEDDFSEYLLDRKDEILDDYLADDPELISYYYHEYTDYTSLSGILEESVGNPEATKLLFDLADELGYYPSYIFGDYCAEISTSTIHKTDSACVSRIKYDNIFGFEEYSLSDVEAYTNRSQYDWHFCPVCFPEKVSVNTTSKPSERNTSPDREFDWKDTPDSTAFTRIAYDSSDNTLAVTFRKTGITYYYFDVPGYKWLELNNAESLGGYYNDKIKDYYEYVRID